MARGPSIKVLQSRFKLSFQGARVLKFAMTAVDDYGSGQRVCEPAETVLGFANKALGGHGVEVFFAGGAWPVVLYVNMGDPYETPLIFDCTGSGRPYFWVGAWGDAVDLWEKRKGELTT